MLLPIGILAGMLGIGCSTLKSSANAEILSVRTMDEVRKGEKSTSFRPASRPIIGLALGGGGLRGYAHVGVLRALEEAGIDVEVIAGTSAGAVIGAAYSSGRTPMEIQQIAEELDVSSLTDWRVSKISLMRGDALTKWVSSMTKNIPIEEMPRRFGAVTTGIDSGESFLIERGDAGLAIRASAAVPGAMGPIPSARGPLVDGGISSLVPVRFARAMGANIVIGVDIYCQSPAAEGASFLTTIAKVAKTQTCLVSQAERAEADIMIAPSVAITDMNSAEQRTKAIETGYHATQEALPQLFAISRSKRFAEHGGDTFK